MLIRHWAELVQRSQTQATRWRVLLDGVPILDVTRGATCAARISILVRPRAH